IYYFTKPEFSGPIETQIYTCFTPLIPLFRKASYDYAILRYVGDRSLLKFYVYMMQDSLKKYVWQMQRVSSQYCAHLNHNLQWSLSMYLRLNIQDQSFPQWYVEHDNSAQNLRKHVLNAWRLKPIDVIKMLCLYVIEIIDSRSVST
ncbi:MAG: hypothetical protein Q8K36_02930, partial [Alphaproteobacteria bacterium]|nr:hypothetical protein [Alphaproteobacteria bacterium]